MKNILIFFCILLVFLLCIGSIQAADSNNTVKISSDVDDAPISESVNSVSDVGAVSKSTIKVKSTTKSYSDLADEINNAKSNSVLVLKGKYKYNPSTDKEYKNGIIISKNIKIVGKKDCIIDGNNKAACFKIESKCKVTLKDITFKNAYSKKSGGAIFAGPYSQLKIYKCVFKNNVVHNADGGAISADSHSQLRISECVFKDNVVHKANGGAISTGNKTILKISNSKFYSNKAIRSSSKSWPSDKRGMGGAIKVGMGSKFVLYHSVFRKNEGYLSIILVLSHQKSKTIVSTAYVKKCWFEGNTANFNGVFYLDEYGKGTFLKSTFKNNVAKDKGGTLVLDASKQALVKDCNFVENKGIFGGAIDLFKYEDGVSHVSVVSCKFSKNTAKNAGGAIFSDYGILKIKKCKFIENKATVSGGAVEVRKGDLKLIKPLFKKNSAQCGGALLVKNKKSIYSYKSKFVKNKASVKGNDILGIFDDCVSKIKITPKNHGFKKK